MEINLKTTPFSRRDSYLSLAAEGDRLLLRNLRNKWGMERLGHIAFGEDVTFSATPWCINISGNAGSGLAYLNGQGGLVLSLNGLACSFVMNENQKGYGYCYADGSFMLLSLQGMAFIKVDPVIGSGDLTLAQSVANNFQVPAQCGLNITAMDDKCLVYIEVSDEEHIYRRPDIDVNRDVEAIRGQWEAYLAETPRLPDEWKTLGQQAWYLLWSCYVPREGFLAYDAVLMSKGCMAAVWSWDHCFNALALSYRSEKEAIEQFLLHFELQTETGAIPDFLTAKQIQWLVAKPPIHGWCFLSLMERFDLPEELLKRVYAFLTKWTEWYFETRDTDGNGIPEYMMGVDSGWDNSTLFDCPGPVESPELLAFLVIQTEALSVAAGKLHDADMAKTWMNKSNALLDVLFSHFWKDNGLIARNAATGIETQCPTSLLPFVSLVLGKRFNAGYLDDTVRRLHENYRTSFGFATEAPSSPLYQSDGYWRGPIWAPVSYLLADGLYEAGYIKEAVGAAEDFCKMLSKADGFYENYDALTGEGLCDTGYTWTASVALLFIYRFLADER